MNVLVYSGQETDQHALTHTLSSLRSLLLPHYTVQSITPSAVGAVSQAWRVGCALFVLPSPRGAFGVHSKAGKAIKDYVDGGGLLMILGTGAVSVPRSMGLGLGLGGAPGSGSFTMDLGSGDREADGDKLRIFDALNSRYITFDTNEVKPQMADLKASDGTIVQGIQSFGRLSGFDNLKGINTLARYEVDDAIAGLSLEIGSKSGKLALWSANIEQQQDFFRTTLISLGLSVPNSDSSKPLPSTLARPLPQYLTCTPGKQHIVSRIVAALAASQSQTSEQLSVFKDANDEFHFHCKDQADEVVRASRDVVPSDQATWQPKHIIVCPDGWMPDKNEATPLFDLIVFYDALSKARDKEGLDAPTGDGGGSSWGMGEAMLYGEVVTSTQTMLDKNPKLLSSLPTPFLSLASHQLAGRGRGSNVWLSPSGCLQFSLLLRVSSQPPTSHSQSSSPAYPYLPPTKLVFIQYLFALSVVEACRDDSVLGPKWGEKVRLKWPNDLYACVGSDSGRGEDKEDLRKIGGVLVNTSFQGGMVDIVIGCGLNVLNPPPITSLSQLQLSPKDDERLSMERTAAAILSKFAGMWDVFLRENGSFEPFNGLYLERWLHTDQLVTLTTTNPPTKVRIVGITPDHGLLRTVSASASGGYSGGNGGYVDLQPDGNSFDLMAGLIKSKG